MGGCLRAGMVEVVDLGLNVTADAFVEAAVKQDAQVIGISSMMVHTARGENGASGVRSLLRKEGLENRIKLHEKVSRIYEASLRARDLVDQILTFSRRQSRELKPLKIQAILKEALKLLRSSIPRTIAFETHIDPGCGAVIADPTQIHQVIMNLATRGKTGTCRVRTGDPADRYGTDPAGG